MACYILHLKNQRNTGEMPILILPLLSLFINCRKYGNEDMVTTQIYIMCQIIIIIKVLLYHH